MFHPDGPTFWELARQALSSTQHGYDLLAAKFDLTPFRTPSHVLDAVQQALSNLAPFETGLDVCCGTGAAMAMLQPLCRHKITGVDFSQGMLNVAAKNLSTYETPQFDLQRQDVLDMQFADQYELAVSFSAFGHILPRDQDQFLSRVAAALQPAGYFAFVTNRRPKLHSRDFWLSHAFNAAMRVRNLVIRPPFIMYYLTFLWPQVKMSLERNGFQVMRQFPVGGERNPGFMIVIAQKQAL